MQIMTVCLPVIQRQEIMPGVMEIICKNETNFSFLPGQYVNVTLDNLKYPDAKGRTRTFNIASSPNNVGYIGFSFLRSNSGFKRTLSEIQLDSKIEIKGPFGTFTLPDDCNTPLTFIADGIGITPCLSMALYAAEEGLPHKITLLYTGKQILPYILGLQDAEKANPNFKLITKTGSIDTKFIIRHINDLKNMKWFVAGTPRAISIIVKTLSQLGVLEKSIKVEEFSGYEI